jgi:hypothetical protein
MPPQEWSAKIQNEHPELFQRKQGRYYVEVSNRRRREILREEWAKAQGQGQ